VAAEPIVVIGAGGHAKVAIAALQAAGARVVAVHDDDSTKWGSAILGVPVVGPVAEAAGAGAPLVIAVGDNPTRAALARRLPDARFATVVHPSAVVHPTVTLGPGAVVFAGAVIQPDSRLGAHAIVNTSASIDHDCVLGDFVHIAPGTHLAGNVTLGEGVFLGVNCAAIPGVSVGAWTTVGAGGVIVASLPAHVTAVGVPARVRGRP